MIEKTLFQAGDFTLASGARSSWKIECDVLSERDWEGLALMLIERVRPFGLVRGVPRGGQPLADALYPLRTKGLQRLLVVDDVWTTGGSMERFISEQRHDWEIDRAVVFARNPVPNNVVALFTMSGRRFDEEPKKS